MPKTNLEQKVAIVFVLIAVCLFGASIFQQKDSLVVGASQTTLMKYASTTQTSAVSFCLTGDSCITSWTSGTLDGTFSTTSAIYFVHSSTTIPKTYTANTFSLLNTFTNSTSTLFTSTTAWVGTLTLTNALTVANGGTGSTTLSTNLLKGNGTGVMNAFAGTSCTNQFVRSLNGAGTATCATVALTSDSDLLTVSPAITGAWAFNNAATTTVAKGLYSDMFASRFYMATSTTATSTFAGNIWVGNNLDVDGRLSAKIPRIFSVATSTPSTGTTTRIMAGWPKQTTVLSMGCNTEGGGTFLVQIGDGTSSSTAVTSAATQTTTYTTLSSNATFTTGEVWFISFGSPSATTIRQLTCGMDIREDI
jgi:hypothetical protein